jgi:hypothetical protein
MFLGDFFAINSEESVLEKIVVFLMRGVKAISIE